MSIYQRLLDKKKAISVTGLGYVGLPLALEFAKHFRVIGFDINEARVDLMKQGIDPSNELAPKAFEGTDILFTSNPKDLQQAHFHIIGVPTDIDEYKVPDLTPLLAASKSIGKYLKSGDYVVYESTVYPGCTEEDCLPILEKESGLTLIPNATAKNLKSKTQELEHTTTQSNSYETVPSNTPSEQSNNHFSLGYSPERIVPGDKVRTLTKILKIVSGHTPTARQEIGKVYNHILENGIYEASSIKVAEAAKVIENTQRDINISLMNELAIIFDKIGIDTNEVIEAAGTKWNFHKYKPGLVGGHCISVDPFYLLHKAKQLGHDPQVIAAGRRVNDYIPHFIAKRLVQTLIEKGKNPRGCKVLVMGITFKENVSDIRNSKVVDLVRELMDYSLNVHVVDPYASPNEVAHAYGISMVEKPVGKYDAIVLAVGHEPYQKFEKKEFDKLSRDELILFDIKGIRNGEMFENYWRL